MRRSILVLLVVAACSRALPWRTRPGSDVVLPKDAGSTLVGAAVNAAACKKTQQDQQPCTIKLPDTLTVKDTAAPPNKPKKP